MCLITKPIVIVFCAVIFINFKLQLLISPSSTFRAHRAENEQQRREKLISFNVCFSSTIMLMMIAAAVVVAVVLENRCRSSSMLLRCSVYTQVLSLSLSFPPSSNESFKLLENGFNFSSFRAAIIADVHPSSRLCEQYM